MNRIQAGVTTGIQYVLAINTTTTIPTGGSVTIEFPDAEDTTWCRTSGTITATGVSSSIADLTSTGWDIDAVLPGTLVGNCSQGSGVGSSDKITITGLTQLTAGTTYGVSLVANTAVLGTNGTAGQKDITVTAFSGAVSDSMTFKIQLVTNDQVVVSATVSAAPSVGCTISANSVNLGTLYPGGNYAIGAHDISTSATSGYYWAAYGTGNSTDAGLYKSTATTYLIQSGPTATLDLTLAGSEGFGITVSQPSGATVPAAFSNAVLGTFGTLDRLPAGAKLILYQNGAQGSSESATVTYGARAGAAAVAGAYQETVTFVCGGYY